MDNKVTGTMTLTTWSSVALMEHEVKGQMSDGMWENSRPHDHWRFWCRLDVTHGGADAVTAKNLWDCTKASYNIAGLKQYIGDRMLKLARMGKAAQRHLTYEERLAAEYMPETVEGFWAHLTVPAATPQYSFVKKYISALSPELVEAYYTTEFGPKDLNGDIKRIKAAIKTVKEKMDLWR